MDKKRLYVDFHVIQTVPPSCINRDDTGRPKTAVYGGVNRARVSSQCWKHAMREMFHDIFSDRNLGFRTKYAVELVADSLKKISPEISDEDATKKAIEALGNAGLKTKKSKDGKDVTDALFFISAVQAEKLAKLISDDENDKDDKDDKKNKKGKKDKNLQKVYVEALRSSPSIDIALFGRMLANNAELNVDASSQVAHSISTHAIQNEYDYFTAVDDCSPADNAGAGHLGTKEFNSATLYRYATVNAEELFKSIGSDTAEAVAGFAKAFICSMPTGSQNSYANRTFPDVVYVTIRKDQPVNLSGAFEKPVKSREGNVKPSADALFENAEKVYSDYCGNPEKSFVIGYDGVSGAEKVSLTELFEKLKEYIADEVK